MNPRSLAAIWLLAMAMPALGADPSPEAAATIVLYNANEPASRALAEYYAGRRNIPASQLVGLPCSSEEEISRDEYSVTIEAPLRAAFAKFGWWQLGREPDGRRTVVRASVRFVAIMRGVPLKIRPDPAVPVSDLTSPLPPGSPMETLLPHNEAAVDSELSTLFTLRESLPAFVPNGYYRRFTPILDLAPAGNPLLVCRLDAPSDAIVRRMIDDSISAEQTGLWGWAYLDARSVGPGAYAAGDQWLFAAGTMMRREGIPVISDLAPETLPEGFPVTDAAIYYGWYEGEVNGPFARPDFQFLPGAIAVHLHSFNARTLRDAKAAWAAPLLAHGAAATMGNVYEPFLELTVHFDIFQDRLMNGLTLAESAYAATRGLSWMNIVVGDPLYRPYAAWLSIRSDDMPPSIWQQYRSIVKGAGGNPLAAAGPLRALAAREKNSLPLEALGQAQAGAGDFASALATLDEASRMERNLDVRFRLALEGIDILRRAGRVDDAREKIGAALEVFSSDEAVVTLGHIALTLGVKPARMKR